MQSVESREDRNVKWWHSRSYFRALAGLLTVLLCGTYALAQHDRTVFVTKTENRVNPLIESWEVRNKTTVDPRLAREMAGEVVHFREIYAFDYSGASTRQPRENVMVKLNDDRWLQSLVHAQLSELALSEQQVESLFSRLARAVGHTAQQAGWPSHVANPYVLNDLRGQLSGGILLISEGLTQGEYKQNHKFLIGPGTHELKTSGGESFAFDVDSLPPASAFSHGQPQSGLSQRARGR